MLLTKLISNPFDSAYHSPFPQVLCLNQDCKQEGRKGSHAVTTWINTENMKNREDRKAKMGWCQNNE